MDVHVAKYHVRTARFILEFLGNYHLSLNKLITPEFVQNLILADSLDTTYLRKINSIDYYVDWDVAYGHFTLIDLILATLVNQQCSIIEAD